MRATVGMVGVGLMGHGIAKNIVSKGWPLQFLEHPGNQPVQDLIAKGATSCAHVAELAQASSIIVLCVTGTPQVEAVLLGENGALAAIRPGTIIIDCSTAIPASTEAIAKAVARAGGRFIDAAMTRTPLEAEQGRLNLLVGGEQAVYEEMLPLLRAFAENIFYAGPAGSGHKLKLLHNYVSLGFATLLGEAAACARAGGIDASVLVEALSQGGGYGAALDRVAPFLLEGDTSRMQFSVSNALKDISYYNSMAEGLAAQRHIAAGLRDALSSLVDAGFGNGYIAATAEQFGKLPQR
ncbi:NAD-binding protein [Pusillimonas sp. TS35]|uniref:NAD(P)-dependent oxidoreductase n=1 Tax=Paracandidimonas lactea TaxID=2895524 RepID=UPI001371D30E|nr:NAD(P)-dependent oxidoreductase [Paracandidimonas lactea]MYN13081.1 NAD-binding protein [Pusillimonas sp. TS35]